MDADGGYDSYGGATDDQQSFDPATASVFEHPVMNALRTVSILVMFFGWTPFTLLGDGEHSFSGPNHRWWLTLLIVWLSCTAFVGIVALAEKLANRPVSRGRGR
ncbi:hypothetical protein ABZS66_26585 [Dactylosporangium sp. NPDC005572]|uniref:hypothetical protein n=1 Tax=Dactylosporangium sp. NPDC005572 TaxID=3156889 RepID=UPI00339FD0E6